MPGIKKRRTPAQLAGDRKRARTIAARNRKTGTRSASALSRKKHMTKRGTGGRARRNTAR